jgi:hypothetical protein
VFRACAWCGSLLGILFPVQSDAITHGVCGRCLERIRREEGGHGSEVVIVVERLELLGVLAAATAHLPGVTVIQNRRTASRRQRVSPVGRERRRWERRRPLHSQRDPWLALGVQVVPVFRSTDR